MPGSSRTASSGCSGVDTRRLTRLIRDKGPPNGVIAYEPDGRLDLAAMREEARAWPGLEGMDLAHEVTCRQSYEWRRDGVAARQPATAARKRRGFTSSRSITAPSATSCACWPSTAAGSRWCRRPRRREEIMRHRARRHLSVERAGRPGRDRRIRRAGIARADRHRASRCSASASATRCWRWRSAADAQDGQGPSRRQPPGARRPHRQGRDHQPEPRLRRRSRQPARQRRARPTPRCSTAPTRACG